MKMLEPTNKSIIKLSAQFSKNKNKNKNKLSAQFSKKKKNKLSAQTSNPTQSHQYHEFLFF